MKREREKNVNEKKGVREWKNKERSGVKESKRKEKKKKLRDIEWVKEKEWW